MGGRGSTRWKEERTRTAVESCYSISAILPYRRARFQFEEPGVWFWKNGGFWAIYHLRQDSGIIVLKLSFTRYGREMTQNVSLCSTRPNYGGVRWWFACPLCDRRVRDLHLPNGSYLFGCRHCHNLSYESAQCTRSGIVYWLFKSKAIDLGLTFGRARDFVREDIGGYVHRPMLLGQPPTYPASRVISR